MSKIHEKSNFKRFLPYFASRWPPENLFFRIFFFFSIFTYWHQQCQVLRWLGVCSISNSVWKMSIFQISLRNPYKLRFFSFRALKKKAQKNWFCLILKDGNTLTHKIDIYGLLKTPVEFCYGMGARDLLWAPRLNSAEIDTRYFRKGKWKSNKMV